MLLPEKLLALENETLLRKQEKPPPEEESVQLHQEKVLCLCDDARIKQVLTNLITNAIDYSKKEKGKIHITLFSDKKSFAKIVVKDNGIGISSSHFEKIFQKFYQIDAPSVRERNGIGLGLTVCKCIIESHGGKIWAESNGKDEGCEFHVLLPLEKKLC